MSKLFSKEQLYELYVNQKIPIGKLGNLYGVGTGTIREYLAKYSIPLKSRRSLAKKWEPGFRYVYNSYVQGAKRRGYLFDLTERQFHSLIGKNCHYCGKPPTLREDKNHRLSYNGVDRIDTTQGYTIENSVPCCKICNYMKSNNLLLMSCK